MARLRLLLQCWHCPIAGALSSGQELTATDVSSLCVPGGSGGLLTFADAGSWSSQTRAREAYIADGVWSEGYEACPGQRKDVLGLYLVSNTRQRRNGRREWGTPPEMIVFVVGEK